MPDPHAHHFPYKKGRGKQQITVEKIHSILALDYDIDPIKGKEVVELTRKYQEVDSNRGWDKEKTDTKEQSGSGCPEK